MSFTGERKVVTGYDKSHKTTDKIDVLQGSEVDFGLGSLIFITFYTYALDLWCGSQFIIHGGYSGGRVLNVIFTVLSGSM